MKTFDDLDALLAQPDVSTVTIDRNAQGKFYATVYYDMTDRNWNPINAYGETSADAISAAVEARGKTKTAAPKPALSPLDDML